MRNKTKCYDLFDLNGNFAMRGLPRIIFLMEMRSLRWTSNPGLLK